MKSRPFLFLLAFLIILITLGMILLSFYYQGQMEGYWAMVSVPLPQL